MTIMFNEFGNIPYSEDLQAVEDAKKAYWEVVKLVLDKMTMVEVRAFQNYTNLDYNYAEYILRRAMNMKKEMKTKEPL